MKKSLILIFAGILVFAACKSKKSTATAKTADPNDAQLTALKTKMPDATMDDLKKGHDIFYGACTNCHAPKNVKELEEARLEKVINNMSKKAQLSDQDKAAVWKYALAVNLAAKK